jgi:Thioredoxin-like
MKALIQIAAGAIFLIMLATGLRYVFGIVRTAITEGGVRGMVLWQTDWNDALADAAARHKRVLVEFARESSPNCHELAKKCWSRMDIVSVTSDYVPVLLDIDAHQDLAKKYAICIVPSILVIDAGDQTILHDGRDETFTPDELLVWLKPDARQFNVSVSQDGLFNSQSSRFDSQKNPFTP